MSGQAGQDDKGSCETPGPVKDAKDPRETLERRSSKSRLSKQDEVEETEEDDHSPSSEASDATIVPTGVETPVVETPGGSPESNSPDDPSKLESQKSVDSDKSSPTQGNPKTKVLVRSKAVCDDTSPPPDNSMCSTDASNTSQSTASTTETMTTSTASSASVTPAMATLTVSPAPHRRHRLEKDSSQGSMSDNSNSPMLSRDNSMEYTDSTGTDLESFIKMTLNKNRTDRMTLLDLEKKMSTFIKDSKQQFYKFKEMSSYHRMLVHRVAAFFGLDHNVDQSGKCVVVNRTTNTRIPDFRFNEHISDEVSDDKPKQLLKRDGSSSFEERSPDRKSLGNKSRSLEERQDNYEQVKKRIFKDSHSSSSQESNLHEVSQTSGSRSSVNKISSRTSSREDQWLQEPRWSSADSSGYSTDNSLKANLKMTKASSFPIYSVLRSDSRTSSTGSTRLSKTNTQDSLSSGTSSLSSPMNRPPTIPSSPPVEQMSESSGSNQSATSPSQLHPHPGDSQSPVPIHPFFMEEGSGPMAIWVASSVNTIPKGSIIINKQTGQPYLNKDGSLYRWSMPPHIVTPQGTHLQAPHPTYPQPGPHPPQGATHPQQPGSMAPQQMMPGPQGDVYTGGSTYNGQPQAQQMAPAVVQQHIPQDGLVASELPQQLGHLTLTPQHSTESLPPEPPGGQQAQPQMYASVGQPQSGISQPGVGGQPGYLQPQQVQFAPNTSTSGPQIRVLYPGMPYQRPASGGQGQLEVTGQQQMSGQPSQGQAMNLANGQYGAVQQGPYQIFPQLTVQSVETYQQQGYPQSLVGQYGGDIAVQQQQQQQQHLQQQQQQQQQQAPSQSQGSEMAACPVSYGQYSVNPHTGGMMTVGTGQGSFMPVQGYIPPQSVANQHMMAFPGSQGNVQGLYSGSQASYRPKSPPSQVQTSGLSTAGSNGVGVTPSIGQPMTNLAPVNQPYVPYTYPNQPGQQAAPHPSQPTPQAATGPMGGPRHPTPQMWSGLGHQGIAPGQTHPATQFQMIRPQALPIGLGDSRFIGQPLQQVARPPIPALFATAGRPRVPNPSGAQGQGQSGVRATKSRKLWSKGGRDTTLSPQSSLESTESNEDLLGPSTLEVYGFPPSLMRGQLECYLDDLLQKGARLHILQDTENNGAPVTKDITAGELGVFAMFDSDVTATEVLSCHNQQQYKLRPTVSRPYDPTATDLATISEQHTS